MPEQVSMQVNSMNLGQKPRLPFLEFRTICIKPSRHMFLPMWYNILTGQTYAEQKILFSCCGFDCLEFDSSKLIARDTDNEMQEKSQSPSPTEA